MLKTRIVSSMEKPFPDERIESYNSISKMSALLGERVSVQLLYVYEEDEEKRSFAPHRVELSGDLAPFSTVRELKYVGVYKPVGIKFDDNYVRTSPGVYPDLLYPIGEDGNFCASLGILGSLWLDIELPSDSSFAGERELRVSVYRKGGLVSEDTLTVDLIGASLPKQKLVYTQWLSNESLVEYYSLSPWSKRHFEIIENYVSRARKYGMNMLMLPVFSGLVGIDKNGSNYSFSYSRLGKFLAMCDRVGIEYYEIPHLFTAGDAGWATSVAYTENGEKKSFSGTPANSPEYVAFLRAFLKSFIAYMKRRGRDGRCFYHIADEPSLKNVELFRAAKDSVADILDGYRVIDAIFDIEYYSMGLVTTPVPISDHIEPFLEAGVPNLWTYYCTGPQTKCSNRFIAQSGACTRSIGMQLYKYDLEGFLHWALNYYLGGDTGGVINPYVEHSGKSWVPAGDTFTLYPAPSGAAYDSMRLLIFHDALQDISAMRLCESLYSKDAVVSVIEDVLGCELRFSTCAKSSDAILRIREKINEMIKAKI